MKLKNIKCDSDILDEVVKVLDEWNTLNKQNKRLMITNTAMEKIWEITQQR